MIRWLVGAIGLGVVATHALAADPIEIGIGYLGHAGVKSKLSLLEQPSANDGLAGARLAIEDNNTTGKFLNQRFTLEEVRLKEDDDVAKAAVALAGRNGFIIADLTADALLKAADALRDRGTVLLERGIDRRPAARAGLPRQCDPYRPDPLDARGRAGAISGVEAMETLAAGGRLARAGQALRRSAAPRRHALRRQDRPGANVRGHRRRPPHRQRRDPDPAPDARVHPAGAGL